MAGRGAVLLLLMVLATTLTEDSAGQDLTAAEDELMDLLEAEGVAESWEARGKGPDFPEEVEAKLKKEEGKDKKRKVKKVGKKEEENEKRKKVKKEGKRGEEENEEKRRKRKKKKAKVGKVCPGGRCVDSSERCGDGRAVRTASCKSGVCCVTASKKQEDEPEDRHRRKCRSRGPCKKVWGKCMPKRIGCPKGQTMLVNSKQLKYCSKNKCVCCTDEKPQPECVSKKCAKRKGFCTTDKKECPGEIKVSKKFCSGANCVCCLPSKSCKINSKCEDLGGTCVDIKLGACKTQPLVGKEYCKGGKKCGCCVPEEEPFKWGYTDKNGPATWPANFPTCGGSRQSPVALVAKDAVGTNPWIPFNFENYRETPTSQTLLNNGHTAMVMLEQKNPPALFGGDLDGQYNFLQYHFHWGKDSSEGSEHTIDGKKFPGEIHLVHWKASYGSVAEAINFDDGIAVLGIMLELSKTDNAYLNPIFDNLDKITKADAEVKIPPFALNRLLPLNVDDFFRYEGSLTTPTCNEIVIWTVFKDTVKISYKQLAKFRTLMDEKGNLLVETFRPVQPLNGREVAMGRKSPYWSYVPPFGPSNWADSFPICGSDVRQSPVALVTADAVGEFPRVNLGTKFYDTPPENLILFNNGHTAQARITYAAGKEASIKGGDLDGKYQLLQFHFHWGANDGLGSEHTIDGKRFPLEIHLVHWKTSYGSVSESLNFGDGLAVLGIMAEISQKDNPKLQPIIDALANIHEPDEETVVDSFIFRNLLPDNIDSFFRYEGSLTTPTCNEIVIWTVLRNTIPISSKQLAEFRKLRDDGGIFLQNNFRQPLPLNGRQVFIASETMHWSYVGATAAENWPAIFDKCVGDRQSPVALKTSSAVTFTPASFVLNNYDTVPTKMTALNNAHTAQFMLESPSVPFVSGGGLDGNYNFLQFHLHWGADDTLGSEHTIDGQRFPAELHLVHWKASYGSVSGALPNPDGIAVLGVMLEISPNDNPKLQEMINALADIREAKTEVEITPFALGNVLPSNLNDYFRYLGSLTTPTCNEIVIWTVFKQSIPISSKQLEEFRKLEDESGLKLVDNFRPLQDLAGRTIQMT